MKASEAIGKGNVWMEFSFGFRAGERETTDLGTIPTLFVINDELYDGFQAANA